MKIHPKRLPRDVIRRLKAYSKSRDVKALLEHVAALDLQLKRERSKHRAYVDLITKAIADKALVPQFPPMPFIKIRADAVKPGDLVRYVWDHPADWEKVKAIQVYNDHETRLVFEDRTAVALPDAQIVDVRREP